MNNNFPLPRKNLMSIFGEVCTAIDRINRARHSEKPQFPPRRGHFYEVAFLLFVFANSYLLRPWRIARIKTTTEVVVLSKTINVATPGIDGSVYYLPTNHQ